MLISLAGHLQEVLKPEMFLFSVMVNLLQLNGFSTKYLNHLSRFITLRLRISILTLWAKMAFLFIMGVGIILGMIIRKNMLVKVRTGQNLQPNIMLLNLLNLLIVKVKFMGTLLIMRVLIMDMN